MPDNLLTLTAQIIAAHTSNHRMSSDKLPDIIRGVYRTLATVAEEPSTMKNATPAVEVRKSVVADHLVCLECGKHFKTLKRHLMSDHELTPHQYQHKYDLPHSYPMVAPDYAKLRSGMAKKIGLGLGGRRAKKKGRR